MLEKERAAAGSDTVSADGVRGGWLCDEVGMGKTLVCISLVCANPQSARDAKALAQQVTWREFVARDADLNSAKKALDANCTVLRKLRAAEKKNGQPEERIQRPVSPSSRVPTLRGLPVSLSPSSSTSSIVRLVVGAQ